MGYKLTNYENSLNIVYTFMPLFFLLYIMGEKRGGVYMYIFIDLLIISPSFAARERLPFLGKFIYILLT